MLLNGSQGLVGLEHDAGVRESQHAEPEALQVCRANLVIFEIRVMAAAVDFDDEVAAKAHEVDDVWAERMLTPERVTGETVSAEELPEAELGGRRPEPKQSGGADAWIHELVNA